LPARELCGDMFFKMNQNENALQAYEAVLKKSPDRFNSLYGAGKAAEKSGNNQKAIFYYKQLSTIAGSENSRRPELAEIRSFLIKH
jgi:tetratricopeptide (TPR) repeat protein